ncbi:paraquat-inducible protein B [Salmonella enterica subsp. enterica]|uniref:Paraquat-inducible protein B n=1 Tax=Salmonella enterica I TaxID=59201 RepID=A0A379UNT4_SALET|nr:paraquat-inducible protein B [Salmonella enterica subsp. enterica]
MEPKKGEAKVQKVKNWSPVWIFPIVTALIGAWILFYHYSHQGPEVTLITTNAEGIEGGKTTIKSRSVDVGVVESATLTDDLTHVQIKARLHSGMEKLLHKDSVFWVVKPQVGREGISGLGRCYQARILNYNQEVRAVSRKAISFLTHRRWRRPMPKVFV